MNKYPDKRQRLSTITPQLLASFRNTDHNIGVSEYGNDEYDDNFFCFDQDGWYFEIEYRCCGKWAIDSGDYWNPPTAELLRGWGEVTELSGHYIDGATGDETDFDASDLSELRIKLNEILKSIA